MDTIINSLFGHQTMQAIVVEIGAVISIISALFLGLFVGYERSYRGRAAGMRTYGLVCMSSCALTVVASHPEIWFAGHTADMVRYTDPGRVIQGITTGIGFLGAGVIMRDGLNISGLTTAASIWTVAAIGVLVGMGFYGPAIALSVIATIFMMWGGKIENFLPVRHAVAVTLQFDKYVNVSDIDVFKLIRTQGYDVAEGSFSICQREDKLEWRFVAVSQGKRSGATLIKLCDCLRFARGIQDFHLSHARN